MTVFTDDQMRKGIASSKNYCVVILRSTSRRKDPGMETVIWEHGRRNFGLRADGVLPIVCPVNDGTKKIMDDDPGVKAGVFN